MAKKIELIGKRFGRLTIVEEAERRPNRASRRWLCRCDCGGTTVAETSNLTSGNTASCGCAHREKTSAANRSNLVGKTFGRLTVTEFAGASKKGSMWRCRCSCGGEKIARTDSLTSGNTASCGCIRAERIAESNRVDISGKVFGKLTAIAPTGRTIRNSVEWRCSCSCGGEKLALAARLAAGLVISCGCASSDTVVYSPEKVRQKAAEYGNRRRARKIGAGGSFTKEQVAELYRKQRGRCAWCNKKIKAYHRDHRKSLHRGGNNSIHNIELLCGPCNLKKGAKDEIAWSNECGRLI